LNTTDTARLSKVVSGIFVITAILCNTGCGTVQTKPMAAEDLDYFQVDCRKRTEQIAMLQSMRSTRDDKMFARVGNMLQPWQVITDPDAYNNRHSVGLGRSNWLLNQKLMELGSC